MLQYGYHGTTQRPYLVGVFRHGLHALPGLQVPQADLRALWSGYALEKVILRIEREAYSR